MIAGTRVLYPEEVGMWDAEILQISLYRGMKDNMEFMRKCADACTTAGLDYVIHPVHYSLLEEDTFTDLLEMAELADLALIIHDERMPDGSRLDGPSRKLFGDALEQLRVSATVSIENAVHTGDAQWFWDSFADSITLDIGHVESFGLNSKQYVQSLSREVIEKIQFVHIHRNNGLHGGITDHWPLTPECREVSALRALLKTKPDVSVILEINEVEEIGKSLDILRSLREES